MVQSKKMAKPDFDPPYTGDILTLRRAVELPPTDHYTWETIHAQKGPALDPVNEVDLLRQRSGVQAVSIDLGGTNFTKVGWTVNKEGVLEPDEKTVEIYKSSGGHGYLTRLERIANEAVQDGIPVGISFAGPAIGTRPQDAPNMKALYEALVSEYGGDFLRLFPTLRAFGNDAASGLRASLVHLARETGVNQRVEYIIVGTGLGIAGFTDNVPDGKEGESYIVASETGHVSVPKALNNYGEKGQCGMFGNTDTCIEMVGAGKGIEHQWMKHRGEYLSGREIAKRMAGGDALAAALYDQAAQNVAFGAKVAGQIMGIWEVNNPSTIVYHGGVVCEVPGFRKRVDDLLEKNVGRRINSFTTKESVPYACAQGAAIGAVLRS